MHDMIRKAEHRINFILKSINIPKTLWYFTGFQPSCKTNESLDSRDKTFALGDKTLDSRDESQDETLVSREGGS